MPSIPLSLVDWLQDRFARSGVRYHPRMEETPRKKYKPIQKLKNSSFRAASSVKSILTLPHRDAMYRCVLTTARRSACNVHHSGRWLVRGIASDSTTDARTLQIGRLDGDLKGEAMLLLTLMLRVESASCFVNSDRAPQLKSPRHHLQNSSGEALHNSARHEYVCINWSPLLSPFALAFEHSCFARLCATAQKVCQQPGHTSYSCASRKSPFVASVCDSVLHGTSWYDTSIMPGYQLCT